jgi:adenylate cyclase
LKGTLTISSGRQHGLFWKYVGAFVALVFAALVLSGLVQTYATSEDTKGSLVRFQRERAVAATTVVETYLKEMESKLLATIPLTDGPPENDLAARRRDYQRLVQQDPTIRAVRLIDRLGVEQIRVGQPYADPALFRPWSELAPLIAQAPPGRLSVTPAYWGASTTPYVSLALPEPTTAGGTILAELELSSLQAIVSRIRIGSAAEVYVLDQQGTLLAHPNARLVARHSTAADLLQLQEIPSRPGNPFGGREVRIALARDRQDQEVVVASVLLDSVRWQVVVEQSLGEVFQLLYSNINRTALLLSIGLLASILVSLVLARTLTIPMQKLQAGAARIAAGDLQQRIEVHTRDEVQALAEEFNYMSEQLAESYTTLEARVEERTRQLTTALGQLELARAQERQNAETIRAQATQLEEWNRSLAQRVEEQVGELERVSRLKGFLSPQLAELIVSSGDESILESHRREITVLFCDLRGFTAFSETAAPEEVMAVLHQFHAVVGELIGQYEGTLEHFAGDGLMCFFNDPIPCPNPAERAIRVALGIRDRMANLLAEWQLRGHELGYGIGIAHGFATLGKMGFEGAVHYAAIGTVANLASRLCDQAAHNQIVVGQSVLVLVANLVEAQAIGSLELKGFHRPVPAFEILSAANSLQYPISQLSPTHSSRNLAKEIANGDA